MILAALDIGTNSTRLLICKYSLSFNKDQKNQRITPLIRKTQITRLGKNLGKENKITIESAENTIKVLEKYLKIMSTYNVVKFRAVGTRILRDAKNSSWFTEYVYNKLNIKIDVISGQEEARLSFLGAYKGLILENISIKNKVKTSHHINQNKIKITEDYKTFELCKNTKKIKNSLVLVLDIGGGSTEFIIGNLNGEILNIFSIPIGSVVVSEKFLNSNKPNSFQVFQISKFINDELLLTLNNIKKYDFLFVVGLAGTISTLAMIDLNLKRYNRDKIHGYCLNYDNILNIQKKLCSMNLGDRKKIAGLEKKRADIIIGGTQILINIMNHLRIKKIFVSQSDILDGIIYSIF